MLGSCPLRTRVPSLDRFLYGTKAMAPSVMTAASSERGCHYKSQFGGVLLVGLFWFLSWWCIPCFIPCRG